MSTKNLRPSLAASDKKKENINTKILEEEDEDNDDDKNDDKGANEDSQNEEELNNDNENDNNDGNGFSFGKLRMSLGFGKQVKSISPAPSSTNIPGMTNEEVSALAIFTNRTLILKLFPEPEMEGGFRAAYQDFKQQCLDFLTDCDKDKKLETKSFEIAEPYTMFKSECGEKELVFLVSGQHDHGLPLLQVLHSTITNILNSLRPNESGALKTPETTENAKHQRKESRAANLHGLASIEEVFRTMDLEGTGSIDLAAFTSGIRSLGVDWDDKQINEIFEAIDSEGNGTIDFNTFMKFMMKPTSKKSWKEMKRAINSTIALPSIKSFSEDNVDLDEYQKKLSNAEKLVAILEEAMIEQSDANDQSYWRNKIAADREFIRKYQDVVARAMGQENARLKTRLSMMEQNSKALDDDDIKKSPRTSVNAKSPVAGAANVDDLQAQVNKLRRENQELKRKNQAKEKENNQLKADTRRSSKLDGSPRSPSPNRSSIVEPEQAETIMQNLRQEVRDLKKERDELREENKTLTVQLDKAKQKVADLSKQDYDAQLLSQLQRIKQEAKSAKKERNELREETIRLQNIDAKLRAKLQELTQTLAEIDPKMARGILDASDPNAMLDALADNLDAMTEKFKYEKERADKSNEELDKIDNQHKQEIENLQKQIDALKAQLRAKDDKIRAVEEQLNAEKEINRGLQDKLLETEAMFNENKKVKRQLADKEDEVNVLREENEKLQAQLAESVDKTKKFEKQMKLIVKMPGAQPMVKKIERLYKIFKKLDKNQDELLHFEEFATGAAELGFGDEEWEQREAFNNMDKDNDGYVNFDDFKDACLRIMHGGEDKSEQEWKRINMLLLKPPSQWTNDDVSDWLEHIGLSQYQDNFKEQYVDGRQLINLKPQDLKDLGVVKQVHVRKMVRELKDLKRRDDMLSNLQYENEQLKDELRELKENGPTWEAIKLLQQRIRNLEGQLRSERHARENILDSVKQELQNDKRFEELTPDQEDMLAEIAVLKGALANANQKLKNSKTKPKDYGSAYENDAKVEDALVHDKKPIGRFLQKWFVVANHNTQYWISRTNAEIKKQKELWMKEQGLSMDNNTSDENNNENDKKQLEQIKTECLNWILYDTKRERLVHEVRMQGRGQLTDPKNVKVQMSVSQSGPWTDVANADLQKTPAPQTISGFQAKSRFWRIAFFSNHGEEQPESPRWVLYEVQFWGPMDNDVENPNFVIE